MNIIVWASGHWHCIDSKFGNVYGQGDDFVKDKPLEDWPEAQIYLAVPHEQATMMLEEILG